jgi:hypothetical protein
MVVFFLWCGHGCANVFCDGQRTREKKKGERAKERRHWRDSSRTRALRGFSRPATPHKKKTAMADAALIPDGPLAVTGLSVILDQAATAVAREFFLLFFLRGAAAAAHG